MLAKFMKISKLIELNQNVQLVVSALDLKELFIEIANTMGNKKEHEEEKYLTVAETAELLHIDTSTLWRWRKSGYLVPVKLGSKPFYRISDINKLREG